MASLSSLHILSRKDCLIESKQRTARRLKQAVLLLAMVLLPSSLSAIGIEDGLFMGKSAGFEGTIKMRPADFIVRATHKALLAQGLLSRKCGAISYLPTAVRSTGWRRAGCVLWVTPVDDVPPPPPFVGRVNAASREGALFGGLP